jgi:hypothetical protein
MTADHDVAVMVTGTVELGTRATAIYSVFSAGASILTVLGTRSAIVTVAADVDADILRAGNSGSRYGRQGDQHIRKPLHVVLLYLSNREETNAGSPGC